MSLDAAMRIASDRFPDSLRSLRSVSGSRVILIRREPPGRGGLPGGRWGLCDPLIAHLYANACIPLPVRADDPRPVAVTALTLASNAVARHAGERSLDGLVLVAAAAADIGMRAGGVGECHADTPIVCADSVGSDGFDP